MRDRRQSFEQDRFNRDADALIFFLGGAACASVIWLMASAILGVA